jgi:hypothetical protein
MKSAGWCGFMWFWNTPHSAIMNGLSGKCCDAQVYMPGQDSAHTVVRSTIWAKSPYP